MQKLLQGVLCFLSSLFCCCPHPTQAQFEVHPDSSFYTFLDSFYIYYNDDKTEGGIYNQVRRDVLTWGTRLAPHGKMSLATKAMTGYAATYKNVGGVASATGTLPAPYSPNIPWTELGPLTSPVGGRHRGMGQIHRIAFHPQYNGASNQVVYAGSHYGGVYRSDDGGHNWYNYYTDRQLPLTSVSGIAVSNDRVFVCTGNGDYGYSQYGLQMHYEPLRGGLNDISLLHTTGVYANLDGSSNWKSINGNAVMLLDSSQRVNLLEVFKDGGTMRQIIVHPSNDSILMVATSLGIFRTADRGATWTQVLVGAANPTGGYFVDTQWRGLKFHPTNPNIVYASGREVYQSLDGGLTWSSLNIAPTVGTAIRRINITTTPASPNKVYAFVIAANSANSGIYSYDGTSWTLFQLYTANRADFAAVSVSPFRDSVVHVGQVELGAYQPNTSGTGLQIGSRDMEHADIHALEYPPHSDSLLFIGNHGGVEVLHVYTNNAETRYNGLGVATVWSFDDWEGNDSVIVTALQDNGVNHTMDRGNLWLGSRERQDGYGAAIDDHTGTAYLKYIDYQGLYYIEPTALDPFVEMYLGGGTTIDIIHPYDSGSYQGDRAFIGNTFAMVNHPKNEAAYVGFSELYQRDHEIYYVDSSQTFSTIDVWLQGKIFYSDTATNPPTVASLASQNQYGSSCVEQGGTVVGIAPNYTYVPLVLSFTYDRWRRDTLCRTVHSSQYVNDAMPLKSDLKQYQSWVGDRRILEIAFSEDDSTNYTYLATLGDTRRNRRCDFYVNDANSMGCDTCFDIKTATIPIDASAGSHVGDPNPITGIAVDPLNGNRVWISLSGYGSAYKVYYSDDAGDSWTSYDDANGSLAALNLPINGIVYQRGTNDRLYIATDAGIYVREGQGNWLRYGEEFPNVRVTELKINYCVGKLRAATFGRGAWEADLLPVEDNINYRSFRSVDTSETWTTNKNMSRDIRIKAGATLTLQGMTLNMPKGGLIVVEPGGQLLVDSSTLTNLCGQVWQGIEVWGSTAQSQAPYNQGVVLLTNSTVEHAREAVRLWQVGSYPNASSSTGGTGGIILAGNTQFLNNWRSAEFMKYQSNNPYLSEFTNCTFEVDDNMRQEFLGHLSAWDIGGLKIKGCTFQDSRSQPQGDPYGILTLSASVQLTAWNNSGNFQRNSFEGLSRGIVLGSTPSQFSNVVDQTDFTNNNRGLVVRAAGGLKAIRNSFEIGGYDNSATSIQPYGLSILRQGDFVAEQNDFQSASGMPSGRFSLGFWIDDLGSGFNRIRNNTFTSLDIANLAHGNSGKDNSNPFGGLRYLCNGQTSNAFDITVLRAYQAPTGAAIGEDQGDINQPAYNSFSHPLSSGYGIDWHFSNDGSILSNINYWIAPNAPLVEIPTDTNNIVTRYSSNLGTIGFCNLRYTNLGIFKPISSNGDIATLTGLKTDFYQYQGEYQQLLINYQTDTTLAAGIATKGQQMTRKANEVLFYYRNDTTGSNCDSIAVWIGHKVGLIAEYELVEHYWSCGSYTTALFYLSTITNNYTLSTVQLNNHQDYATLLDLLYSAYQAGRTEATLEQEEVTILGEIADNNYGFAAIKAANIINFFYADTYRYHPTLPEGGEEERLQLPMTKVQQGNLVIYPNPTTTWADIRYKLPENIKEGRLVIASTSGQQVFTLDIYQQQGVLTLNTSQWLTGTYFVVLYTEDKTVEQTQLIIKK